MADCHSSGSGNCKMSLPTGSSARIKYRLWLWKQSYRRSTARAAVAIRAGSSILGVLTTVASSVCMVTLMVYIGFDESDVEHTRLLAILRGTQTIFIVNVLYGLILCFNTLLKQSRLIKWIVDAGILLSMMALVYPQPESPWITWLSTVLYSKYFLFTVLGAYSGVDLCFAVFTLMGKRANPSLIMSVSFIFFIVLGSFLLMMPRCLHHPISYVDSLFVSTSAVCITGLTTLDIPSTFTPFGQIILAILIQIGGLGVMTFTSFFALFFKGNTSIYSQLMVKDMIQSKSINALLPTLLYILTFTIAIEAAGALAIFGSIHGMVDGMTLSDEIKFAMFHSLSAFCNAGFSTYEGGMSAPDMLGCGSPLYLTLSLLIVAGGLGFPILVNIKAAVTARFKRLKARFQYRHRTGRPAHIYDMNTKIVLVTTTVLFIISTLWFMAFEWDNTLAPFGIGDKLSQAFFNACNLRSAGFTSVDNLSFFNFTIIMMLMMMWIGGGSQSLAGGIKVNTFAVMLINLKATVLERKHVVVYNRTLSTGSIRRAGAVIGLSAISLFVYVIVLVGAEPDLPVKGLVYEAASALFNVGSSLGITPHLSGLSKIVVCTAMFLGRVGMLSLLTGLTGRRREPLARFPDESIIIN